MAPKLLTTAQAARKLGLAAETVRRHCQIGNIRAQLVGKSWVMAPDALAEFQRKQQEPRARFNSVPQRKPKSHDANWTTGATGPNVKPEQLARNRARMAELQRRHRDGKVQALVLDRDGNRVR